VPEPRRSTPHPFAWILVLALALSIVAAALAPARAPAFALYWNPIYRAEIAVIVLALVYLVAVAGWMAWNGQAFRRIELPGGTVLERDAAELDSAATDFDAFSESILERLDALETSTEDLIDRLSRLEGRSARPESRVP
jgi:hypothetical protein